MVTKKKVSLQENEVLTIKGVDGEEYVFDGHELFVNEAGENTSSSANRPVTVIKSLRTKSGAESWLRVAGSLSHEDAEIVDTDTLKSYGVDYDGSSKYHVIELGRDDNKEAFLKMHPEAAEEPVEPMPEARSYVDSILDDAENLYYFIPEHMDESVEEEWPREAFMKAVTYTRALSSYIRWMDEKDEDTTFVEYVEKSIDDETLKGRVKEALVDVDVEVPEEPEEPEEPVQETKKSEHDEEEEDDEETTEKSMQEASDDAAEEDDEDEDEDEEVNIHIDANSTHDVEKSVESEEEEEGEDPVVGKVFKSLHAARQWNKFENPDQDRYYIDIMRSRDRKNPWDRSYGLNAKYIVRDMADKEQEVQKGAYGNKVVKTPKGALGPLPPEKELDAKTREVAALDEPESTPEDSRGE